MPEIGIVGTNENDNESKEIFASGVLMRELSPTFSNFRAQKKLTRILRRTWKNRSLWTRHSLFGKNVKRQREI